MCERLRRDPALLARAQTVLQRWRSADSSRMDDTAERWARLLGRDLDALVAAALDPGEAGRQLRQSSPLAVLLPPRERWAFIERWRAQRGA